MPFGKKAPPGKRKPLIDFDRVHAHLSDGARRAGLEVVRADFEPGGGFIHKPMLERLLVAEYVIADVTFSNPNVLYEVGVRHGASARATLLVCAEPYVRDLAFDLRPLRVLPYALPASGAITPVKGKDLAERVRQQLAQARGGTLPVDNPIMQVTSWQPSGAVEHSKTDVFLDRIRFQGETGQRIKDAVSMKDANAAVAILAGIEAEVVELPPDVAQVHTVLLGVFLGYREKKAYDRMVALFARFPEELKQTPVAREQLALALNRLAEAAENPAAAEDLRTKALAALDAIDERSVTSETYGVRGRIYKGWADAIARSSSGDARGRAMLQQAIDTYELGFRADLRDYYPGVNAVTLRLTRGATEDTPALRALLPVVRYAVNSAKPPKNTEERYWQTATKLELACADRDWDDAQRHVQGLLALRVQPWMRETTAANLRRQRKAAGDDHTAAAQLASLADSIES
jgi:MAP3K TRAFs-binding domain